MPIAFLGTLRSAIDTADIITSEFILMLILYKFCVFIIFFCESEAVEFIIFNSV